MALWSKIYSKPTAYYIFNVCNSNVKFTDFNCTEVGQLHVCCPRSGDVCLSINHNPQSLFFIKFIQSLVFLSLHYPWLTTSDSSYLVATRNSAIDDMVVLILCCATTGRHCELEMTSFCSSRIKFYIPIIMPFHVCYGQLV